MMIKRPLYPWTHLSYVSPSSLPRSLPFHRAMSSSHGRPAPCPVPCHRREQEGVGEQRPVPAAAERRNAADGGPHVEAERRPEHAHPTSASDAPSRRRSTSARMSAGRSSMVVAVSVLAAAAADAPRPPPTLPTAMDRICTELAAAAANPWSFVRA